jgi:hypothetical protein
MVLAVTIGIKGIQYVKEMAMCARNVHNCSLRLAINIVGDGSESRDEKPHFDGREMNHIATTKRSHDYYPHGHFAFP